MTDRTILFAAILDHLPPGWRTTRPSFDPGRGLWEAVAIGPKLGGRRGAAPDTIVGEGVTELDALRDLFRRLCLRSSTNGPLPAPPATASQEGMDAASEPTARRPEFGAARVDPGSALEPITGVSHKAPEFLVEFP